MAFRASQHPLRLAALLVAGSLVGAFGLGELRPGPPAFPPRAENRAPAAAERGRQLFIQSCAHCHGDDALGNGEDGDGPSLHRLAIGNARIAAIIRTGIGEEMPSFARKHGPREIADLTTYLRTLR